MTKATVVTSFIGTGSYNDPFTPAILAKYPLPGKINWYSDITGTMPVTEPNLTVVEIEAEQAVIDEIDLDPDFAVLSQELVQEVM